MNYASPGNFQESILMIRRDAEKAKERQAKGGELAHGSARTSNPKLRPLDAMPIVSEAQLRRRVGKPPLR